MQINRLFEIVYVLLNKKNVTAKQLAERFGVSQRTIYRDVDTLSLAGIPVYTEKGKGGGISLLPDFILSKSIFSETEQHEILSSLNGLSRFNTADTNGVLQKLSAVFNKTAANWIEVDLSDWSYSNGRDFNDLKTAILERRIVMFNYYNSWGEKSCRRVEPLQLWFKSRSWYVKGFCLERNDLRLFKMSRIKNLSVTDEYFYERDLMNIPDKNEDERKTRGDIALILRIAPEMAYRVYDEFGEDCIEIQPDGGFIVSVTYPEDDWVYGYILSFGEHAEVLAPEHIREIIKLKSGKINRLYK